MPKPFLVEVSQKGGFASCFQTIFSLDNPLRCSADKWDGKLRKSCSTDELKRDLFFISRLSTLFSCLGLNWLNRWDTDSEEQSYRCLPAVPHLWHRCLQTSWINHERLLLFKNICLHQRQTHSRMCQEDCLSERGKVLWNMNLSVLKKIFAPWWVFSLLPSGREQFFYFLFPFFKRSLGGCLILNQESCIV